ncbi:MAG: di-trans,poly-cis-decaprenylcistransferase [Nanoarchaeota archaeon]|nr:di-trans,poly-cis-decaprenylcistransferase [Nanoarchaeota archaeon]
MHVGIIMDGNRRYAKMKKLFPRFRGHLEGKKALETLLKAWIKMKEPKYLTLYAFSLYNFKNRSSLEKKFIFALLKKGFMELLKYEDVFKREVRINFIGDTTKCPKSLLNVIDEVIEKTKNHKKKFLTFAICYDGQQEIVDAVNEILTSKGKKVTVNNFKKYLYTRELPPVDLIVRTGGEKRLSGFLLWDTSYAELIFREETWPEYNVTMLKQDISEFRRRKRRFGK